MPLVTEIKARALSGTRICVLTSGHLATTPRMTKAADALSEAGASVHVLSIDSTDWALVADRDIRHRRPNAWTWDSIDIRKSSRAYFTSGIRQRVGQYASRAIGADRLPLYVAGCARERGLAEIVLRAKRLKVDLIYGGGIALATAFYAARKLAVPFAVDLEDFHTGDQVNSGLGPLYENLSGRIERDVLPAAILRTGGSAEISEAYIEKYGVDVVTINNTFPIEGVSEADFGGEGTPLLLYWFSQTIGPGRGLEDAIRGAGAAAVEMELHLQGLPIDRYLASLRDLAASVAPQLTIVLHPPCFPDDMVRECMRYDVGLAVESGEVLNKRLCLSNKALAYAAAGMAIVLTDLPGHRTLARDLGDGAFVFKEGDVTALAARLSAWSLDRHSLRKAKLATQRAASSRWNWDHPKEKPTFVASIVNCLAQR